MKKYPSPCSTDISSFENEWLAMDVTLPLQAHCERIIASNRKIAEPLGTKFDFQQR